MLGLSFLSSSGLNYLLSTYPNRSSTAGANLIYNILEQNPSVSTFFDIQLHRATDLDDTPDGSLVIGTHMSGFEAIDKAPHLPLAVSGRWAVVLDRMSVNGKAFSFNESVIPSVPSKKIAVTIDSGFTFPPIPPAAVYYIYSSIPGAVYNSQSDDWIVPCNETTDLTFTFGGVDFPMHYLDLTYIYFSEVLVNKQYTNVTFCSNTFTRNKAASIDTVDANLGDPFMRNAYVSFNFNGLTTDGGKSYMQMIPTTDFDTALPDFQASRAKTLASLPPELPPADFLAALHGQSVSSSDLISTPTFNAPPATATADSKDIAANEALRGVYMSLFIPLSAPLVVCLMSVLIAP
ncbi:hypothetical protein EIP86_008160 [Pleurotus ostreatoroseus]|nr:hypothetical protein EIP86_008160 [Pleurotus ostreatoroseus]